MLRYTRPRAEQINMLANIVISPSTDKLLVLYKLEKKVKNTICIKKM